MANEKHLAILKKGVPFWNRWRARNASIKPDLRGAVLRGADLTGAMLHQARLSGSDLASADLMGADLRSADLSRADLTRANLRDSIVRDAQLSGARLTGLIASRAALDNVNLRGAVLWETSLWDMSLYGADMHGSVMQGASLQNVDLSAVKGLERVQHEGPSSIGIDTIYKSKGHIPEVFLRGAGVPEPFIANMKALVAAMEPIEFYSCFISYSTKDQEFADMLRSQLQSKGVRVWLATEDLKIGDKFRTRIDEAIRMYDKLLLVLSKDSVKSSWVEGEVEAAFEKERRQNRMALFPIRLDDAVMEAEDAWAAEVRRMRHIGDFRKWKEHDEFQKRFRRLLQDLKAEEKGRVAK
jgi:hypothetical protein